MRINRPTLAVALALACSMAAAALPTMTPAARATAPATDCEGDACSSVTLTYDDARQQYRAQNNSSDRWARVTASNVTASATACLPPGGADYLPLGAVVGPYQAAYSEPRCGQRGGE